MKSMLTSVEASLKKLRTSYIDILYLHWVSGYYCCGIGCCSALRGTDLARPHAGRYTAIKQILHMFVTATITEREGIRLGPNSQSLTCFGHLSMGVFDAVHW